MNTERVVYFIGKDDQRALVSLLREIPGIVDDLAITITRQDRTRKGGVRTRSGSDEQPLPLNLAASAASDGLRTELAGWARHVCESRGIAYEGSDSIIGIGKWLDQNVVSLSMTEGSEEAYDGIEGAMGKCRRAIDLPPEDAHEVDPVNLRKARETELNARGCADVAKLMGGPYSNLTKRRILYLRDAGRLHPVRVAVSGRFEIPVFNFGDVLDSHLGDHALEGRPDE